MVASCEQDALVVLSTWVAQEGQLAAVCFHFTLGHSSIIDSVSAVGRGQVDT
jgi:hypothetical protein